MRILFTLIMSLVVSLAVVGSAPSSVVEALIGALGDPEPEVRVQAAWALGEIGAREAIPALVAALDDPECDVFDPRHDLAEAIVLALLELAPLPPEAVPSLLSFLERSVAHFPYKPLHLYIAKLLATAPEEAVPLLIEALEVSDHMVRRFVALALGFGKRQEAIPVIGNILLNDPDPRVREDMVLALGYFESEEALAYLIEAFAKEEDWQVRIAIVQALGKYPGAVPTLMDALDDPEMLVRKCAVMGLEILGPVAAHAAPALVEMLREVAEDPDPHQWYEVRYHVKGALVAMGEGVGPVVAPLLGAPDPKLRKVAAEVLGEIRDEEYVPRLVGLLSDEDPGVRAAAVEALGKMEAAAQDVASRVVAALGDPDEDVREAAWRALCSLGPRALPAVEEVIRGRGDIDIRLEALSVIRCSGGEGCRVLVDQFSYPDWRIRQEAVKQFGCLLREEIYLSMRIASEPDWASACVKRALARLLEIVDDPMPGVRLEVAEVLATLAHYPGADPESIAQALGKLLDDPHSDVRARAAMSLGKLGTAALPFLDDLVACLDDFSLELREQAAWALGELGPAARAAVPALLEALETTCPVYKKAARDVRRAAAFALGKIGAPEAIPALAELLDDPDWRVRAEVVRTLRTLGADVLPLVRRALRDEKGAVREAAVEALADIGRPAIPVLIELSDHPDPEIHIEAIRALGRLRATEASPALIDIVLRADEGKVVEAAVKALVRIGPPAVPHLRELLSAPDSSARLFAAAVLFAIDFLPSFALWATDVVGPYLMGPGVSWEELPLPPVESVPPDPARVLTAYLNAEPVESRLVALRVAAALGRLAAELPGEARAYVEEEDPMPLRILSLVFGVFGEPYYPGTFEVVDALMEDVGRDKLVEAAESLAEAILGMISETSSTLAELLCHESGEIRALAAEALGYLGPRAGGAVPALVECLDDPEPEVRTQAAWALGRILGKERSGDGRAETDGG